MAKRVIVAGGSGFIGRALCGRLGDLGYEVTILSRRPGTAAPGVRALGWDGRTDGPWIEAVDGAFAVVNLAGERIDGLWTEAKKARIVASRLDATCVLAGAIRQAGAKPAVFAQGSAVGYYGASGSAEVDESAPAGRGLLADVARAQEVEAALVARYGVRLLLLRTGVVLGAGGGLLSTLLPAFRLGLGATFGDGRAYLPWIHLADAVEAIVHLIETPGAEGPFNLVAPDQRPGSSFVAALAAALHRPAFLAVPAFALRLILRNQADELLLAGQRAVPRRLVDSGFRFRHPGLDGALADLVRR